MLHKSDDLTILRPVRAMGRGQSAYMIGVYGSGLTCSWLLNHNMAERCWLSGSRGWSGYERFNDWDIRQAFDDLNIPASLRELKATTIRMSGNPAMAAFRF